MTLIATVAIAGLIGLLLYREHTLALERESWVSERASLLDRIQFPEVRQVAHVEVEPFPAPKDTAELAHVGMEVPEFVNVGGDD